MGGFNQPPPPPPEGGSRQFEPEQDEHIPFNENQSLPLHTISCITYHVLVSSYYVV